MYKFDEMFKIILFFLWGFGIFLFFIFFLRSPYELVIVISNIKAERPPSIGSKYVVLFQIRFVATKKIR